MVFLISMIMERKIRSGMEFMQQALKKNIKFVPNHDCAICGYTVGYRIYGTKVTYDSGCGCSFGCNERLSSWDEISRFYNNQTSEDVIREMDKFWGFDDPNYEYVFSEKSNLKFTFNDKTLHEKEFVEICIS